MRYENNKFYISNEEIQNLKSIISMLSSPDPEQVQLGFDLYFAIVPAYMNLYFVLDQCELRYMEILIPNSNYVKDVILFKDWIIEN